MQLEDGCYTCPSNIREQAQRVVDCRVGVSGRNRVTDPEQLELPLFVADYILRAAINEIVIIEHPAVAAEGFEIKVQVVQRHGAVIYNNLVIGAGAHVIGIIRANTGG